MWRRCLRIVIVHRGGRHTASGLSRRPIGGSSGTRRTCSRRRGPPRRSTAAIRSGFSITLAADEPGTTIDYTTDGSLPDIGSAATQARSRRSPASTISTTTMVRYFGVHDGEESTVTSETFAIDASSAQSNAGYLVTNVTLDGTSPVVVVSPGAMLDGAGEPPDLGAVILPGLRGPGRVRRRHRRPGLSVRRRFGRVSGRHDERQDVQRAGTDGPGHPRGPARAHRADELRDGDGGAGTCDAADARPHRRNRRSLTRIAEKSPSGTRLGPYARIERPALARYPWGRVFEKPDTERWPRTRKGVVLYALAAVAAIIVGIIPALWIDRWRGSAEPSQTEVEKSPRRSRAQIPPRPRWLRTTRLRWSPTLRATRARCRPR